MGNRVLAKHKNVLPGFGSNALLKRNLRASRITNVFDQTHNQATNSLLNIRVKTVAMIIEDRPHTSHGYRIGQHQRTHMRTHASKVLKRLDRTDTP